MSRLSPAFVLGYHGCDEEIAERVFSGKDVIRRSSNDYDWLGSGAYFWEGDPERAMRWALDAQNRKRLKIPAVVGAVIDLGNCLNLSTQEGIGYLNDAYESYRVMREDDGKVLAINDDPPSQKTPDKLLRRLDNAVIERLHFIIKGADIEPFDTVRGMFREGETVYPGAGFWERTHVQIAVRNTDCIIGYFRWRKTRR